MHVYDDYLCFLIVRFDNFYFCNIKNLIFDKLHNNFRNKTIILQQNLLQFERTKISIRECAGKSFCSCMLQWTYAYLLWDCYLDIRVVCCTL